MFKLQGWVEAGNTIVNTGGLSSSNVMQGSFPSATVTVYVHGSSPATLATLYSDDNPVPTPLANPFTANADGSWGFYADSGRYDVVFSGGDLASPVTLEDLTNGAGGGTGNVTGPGGAVNNDLASFDGTSGLILKDSGILSTNVVQGPASAVSGNVPSFNGTGGKTLQDSGKLASNLVTGPSSATDGNLAVFDGATGKIIKDGGAVPGGSGFIQSSTVNITTGDFTTTSTNFADLTGVTVTITTGAHRCLILVEICGSISVSAPNSGFASLVIDGVATGGTNGNIGCTAAATGQGFNMSFSYLTNVLSASSHTFKIQVKVSGGTLTINSGSGQPARLTVLETALTS